MALIVPASATDTNVSVLSSMSATRGWFFCSTRRENSGGIVSTPLTRPFRRSVRACPWSAYSIVSIVCAPDGGRRRQLAHLDRGHAVILIDDRHLEVLDVAAEGVAEHDQLHDRKDHRHRRSATDCVGIAAARARRWPTCGTCQRFLMNEKSVAGGLLQRIAQRAAGVVHEHVVERRALNRQRVHRHVGSGGRRPSAPSSSPGRCRTRCGRCCPGPSRVSTCGQALERAAPVWRRAWKAHLDDVLARESTP